MAPQHLDRSTLELLASGKLDREAAQNAAAHLLLCGECRTRLRREVAEGDEVLEWLLHGLHSTPPVDYDEVFDRVERSGPQQIERILDENTAAPELVQELLSVPAEIRATLISSESRFHRVTVARALLDRCRGIWGGDLRTAEEMAKLAASIAERLRPRSLAKDIQGRSWSYLGNIYRLGGHFAQADLAFSHAESLLLDGSGDPLEIASLWDLQASLLRAERQFGEALIALSNAARIYRRVGDVHLEGRALLSQALVHGAAGEPEKGIPLLLGALQKIDLSKEPFLLLATFNNLFVDLIYLDRLDEAEALLPRVLQASEYGTRRNKAQCHWAEARLHVARGRWAEAEAKLRQVQIDFQDLRLAYDAELVALELAHVYLLTGRTRQAGELAAALHRAFTNRGIHREALVALHLCQLAAR